MRRHYGRRILLPREPLQQAKDQVSCRSVQIACRLVRRLAQAASPDDAIAAVRALTTDLAEGVRRSR